MYAVKLSTPAHDWPFARQTPGEKGMWGDYVFFEDDDAVDCDFWVVYDGVLREQTARCPRENTILITGEPPSVKRYRAGYLAQFALLVTCHPDTGHAQTVLSHPAQPWHVGRRVTDAVNLQFTKDYDELCTLPPLVKEKTLSVITSNKTITSGHRRRIAFVQALKEHFGDRIDVFGRGIRDVDDKWDAIAPYKYHVVLENSCYRHYWTEKLSDCYLAGAYPFYYGCPNLEAYFPAGSFSAVDLHDPAGSIAIIEQALAEDLYHKRKNDLLPAAKDAILNKYNLYAVIAQTCDALLAKHGAPRAKVPTRIKPETAFSSPLERVASAVAKIKDRIHG